MTEIYTGPKFIPVRLSENILSEAKLESLKPWGMQFAKKGLAPATEAGHAGNLSVRTEKGFLITGAGQPLAEINRNTISEVTSFFTQTKKVLFHGISEPSSEAFMHGLIYQTRPDVNVVFHGHSDVLTALAPDAGYPETEKEVPYGTIEGAEMVMEIIRSEDFSIIKNHGFVSVGAAANLAGEKVLKVLAQLKAERY